VGFIGNSFALIHTQHIPKVDVIGCEILEVGGEILNIVSVGGLETCIELPNWKLCFDIGRCPPTAVRLPRVLFSHAHVDHMGGVAHHCAQRDLMGMAPPTYYLPEEAGEGFEALMNAWRRLSHSEFPCTIVPVAPGQRLELGRQRWAKTFRAIHRIPSVGYVLGRDRQTLKHEFRGKSQADIREAVHAGHQVSTWSSCNEVAFCGDTCIDVVEREESVRTARILILEVTFLDDRVSVASARDNGHVHLDEVIERAALFENKHILFTHFSSRYRGQDIVRILDERLPPSLRERVYPVLPEPPWAR